MYDALAGNYLSPGRNSTTTFFRNIQRSEIACFIRKACEKANRYYGDSKLLIVGAGPQGNFEEYSNLHRLVGPLLDEIDTRNVTHLDASASMLSVCQEYVSSQLSGLRLGTFVKGTAEQLTCAIEPSSQDVIVGALCDHFTQDDFFREAWCALKPGGALITTFPADGINRVIREQLYGIDSGYTRFMLNGNPVLVPSQLMTSVNLLELYKAQSFVDVQTKSVRAGNFVPSQTILTATEHLTDPLEDVPILIAGVGFKPLHQ